MQSLNSVHSRFKPNVTYAVYAEFPNHVIDFSLAKMKRMVNNTKDEQQRLTLVSIIERYMRCEISVGWKFGRLVWKKVILED